MSGKMFTESQAAERRIFYGAVALTLAAGVVLASLDGLAAGGSVLLGGALSLLNYAWLRAGVNALMRAAIGGPIAQPMRWGVIRFLMRFALLAVCVYAILMSHLVPLAPVLGGLFVVPAAAVIEGVRQLTASRAPDVS